MRKDGGRILGRVDAEKGFRDVAFTELPLFFLSTLVTTGFASEIWLTYCMSLSLVTLVSDHSKGFSDLLHFSPLDQPPISKIILLNMG